MPLRQWRRPALAVLFCAQFVVAAVAYHQARADGHAQPFGWQMFTRQVEDPRFTIVRGGGQEEDLPISRVLGVNRSELVDELTDDPRVFEFVCGQFDDVVSVRVTRAQSSRTVQCDAP
jgi:hypothetical protein